MNNLNYFKSKPFNNFTTMKRLFNYLKTLFTADLADVEFTFMHAIIFTIALFWSVLLSFILPLSLLSSLFNN